MDPLDQRLGLKGFRDLTVCACSRCAGFVEGLEGAGQQKHGNLGERRVLLDRFADLVAALAGHHDIREHDIRSDFARLHHGIVAVVRRYDLNVFVGERKPDQLLDHNRIVSQEKRLGHKSPHSSPVGPTCHQRTARSSYRLGLACD